MNCFILIQVSNKCTSCEVQFANYFCAICNLFDDKDKGQFHCTPCGICRLLWYPTISIHQIYYTLKLSKPLTKSFLSIIFLFYRVGGRDNFFHCEKCDMCLGTSIKDDHKVCVHVIISGCS